MRVTNISNPISFKSGYPMFGSGHLTFKGHFDPATRQMTTLNGHYPMEHDKYSGYPGYPGYAPTGQPRIPGRLNLIA